MPYYSYRITRPTLAPYTDILKISTLIVFEDFENKNGEKVQDHFHGLLYHEKGIETVRKLFTKNDIAPLKGNKDYQVKLCEDTQACIRYFFKGKDMSEESIPVPILNRENLCERDYHKSYWAKYKELQKLNKTSKYVSPGIKYWEKFQKEIHTWSQFYSYKICTNIICEQYKEGKSLMMKHHMEGVINYIFMRYLIEVKQNTIECAAKYIAQETYGYDNQYAKDHMIQCECQDDQYLDVE